MIENKIKNTMVRQTARSEKLSKCLEEYDRYCRFKGYSDATICYYLKRIWLFLENCQKLDVYDITKEDVINWNLSLRERELKESYIIVSLWVIKGFCDFLRKELKLEIVNWFEDLKIPERRRNNNIDFLENPEIKKLLNTIGPLESICNLRLRTYIEVMLNTGCRPSEALSLNSNEVKDTDEVEIIGKGRKKRKIYLNERCIYWIEKYLGWREIRKEKHPALFISHHQGTRRWTLRRAEERFRKVRIKSGIKKEITLHDLRHTYATNIFHNGGHVEYVQHLLGHSSVRTTLGWYIGFKQKYAKQAHFKYLNYETDPLTDLPLTNYEV